MSLTLKHVPTNERRAAILALVVSIVLVVAKFVAYFLTDSAAIFADAVESIVNVAAAGFAIYSLYLAHLPADTEHPYGHGKIEFFAAGFEGGMIVLAAAAATVNAIETYLHAHPASTRLGIGFALMASTLAVNGAVGWLLIRIGRQTRSITLVADGRHLLSDAVSTVFALAALLLLHLTGKAWIDPLIAVVVAAYIAWIGIKLVRHAAAGLMDQQDRDDQALLEKILDSHLGPSGADPQICSYHKLRHRHSGRYHWVDFHMVVPAHWDVRHGHEVASRIEYEIEQALLEGNATAHVEPCKDEACPTCAPVTSAITNASSG